MDTMVVSCRSGQIRLLYEYRHGHSTEKVVIGRLKREGVVNLRRREGADSMVT